MSTGITRRHFAVLASGLAGALALGAAPARAQEKVVRIGYQKYGTLIPAEEQGAAGAPAEAARLQREMGRVPRRPAVAGSAQCRRGGFRQHRRGTAHLRPGGRRAPRLCRLRARRPAGRGHPRAQEQPAQDRRRPQGQDGGAEQGVQRPLSPGEGAGEGGRALFRHQDRLSHPRRRPRRLRARLGGCLGHLGPLPGGGGEDHRRAPARRRHRASSPTTSSISRLAPSRTRRRRWWTCCSRASPRWAHG